jgi:AcrR family transcriptional regulator
MLLDAAADALAQNPGASMVEVAKAASLTRATLYRHFGTRQKLLEAMREEALVRAAEAIAGSRLDEGTALEALRRAIDAVAGLGVRFRPLLVEGTDQDPGFLHERAEVFAPLHDVVRRAQDAEEIRPDVPPEWVVTAMAAMLAAGVRAFPVLRADDGTVADLVYSTLIRGVGTDRQTQN